ncbi:hypothetical protein C7B69_07530 [filamentous cyanobacterium Phorm 46]|nr:hypothetical protein C7B69_07530 [filamentous cyanobacterium Phorm 46]
MIRNENQINSTSLWDVPPVLNKQDACSTITIKIVSYLIRYPYLILISKLVSRAAIHLNSDRRLQQSNEFY